MKKTAPIYKTLLYLTGCCFFMIMFFATSQAQTRGKVEVIRDPRVDTLMARRLNPVKGSSQAGGYSSFGYRVQIFSGPNRALAFKAQTKFQESHPDMRTYIAYHEPDFKVHIGDFRTRLEAAKMMQDLHPWFPLMFIISEKINPPKLDTDTQNQ